MVASVSPIRVHAEPEPYLKPIGESPHPVSVISFNMF